VDCSIKPDEVTSNTKSNLRRSYTLSTRVVALLLFAMIVHGATAEIMHKHGGLAPASALLNTASHAASNPEDADSSLNQTRTRNECVICQLHQNLSNTLFSSLPGITPPRALLAHGPAIAVYYSSQNGTAQHGRAPPSVSLF
jgi:Protein of unknown function (DUF2946)